MPSVLSTLIGLGALVIGANLLVRGGTGIAARLGVSPLLIGLTVVSLGTSAPELAIGIDAALSGTPELATGNIVGTNIVNVLLILGLSALIRPIRMQVQSVRLDGPVIAVAGVLFLLMGLNGVLTRLEGLILLVLGVGYTLAVIRFSRRESAAVRGELSQRYSQSGPEVRPGRTGAAEQAEPRRWRALADGVRLVAGIALVIVGADWLVSGSVQIAAALGVSDALIGLTIVAIGTSAPELVTTLVATAKGERDIAIGNLIGSSVYNILFIMGATMLISPAPIEVPAQMVVMDLGVMTAVALACVPVFWSGRTISRLEGGVFVAAYAAYLTALILLRT
ncbi:MAG TPA: calcium/sodium antiporter [Beutenbergiaceae bacterium]|nr:calcium/sodium antiporter [Beutenbergiaceae bacterium]